MRKIIQSDKKVFILILLDACGACRRLFFVSPADGRVTRVEENENGKFVSIFLSPVDVHINRSPIAGKITKVDYIFGKKMPATSNNASLINERNSLTIEGEKITVICTQ